MRKSPAHYAQKLREPWRATNAMRFGDLVDRVLFERELLPMWGGKRQGKLWENYKTEHQAAYDANEIVSLDEYSTACDIVAAVKANREAMKCLEDGSWQYPLRWQIAGRDCMGTPDVLAPHAITDLKVTDSNPSRFSWHARRQAWHGQLCWYAAAVATLNGGEMPSRLSIIAAEPDPPHVCVVYDLSPRCIDEGHKLWRSLFERLRVCEESDCWPGYCEGISIFDVPDDESVMLHIDGEEVPVE